MIGQFASTICLSILLITSRVWALSAIQGSPCYDPCQGGQATSSGDIVCTDDDFTNSTKGETLTSCLTCLQNSTYSSGHMTDQILFIYYLSSVQQTCLSGKPAAPISNCSNQCGDLSSAFSAIGGAAFFRSPWSYCTANDSAYDGADACATCLQGQQGTVILGNCVHVGKIGCDTQPDIEDGASVYPDYDLFSTDVQGGNGSSTSNSANTTSVTTTSSSAVSSSTSTPSATAAPTVSSSSSEGIEKDRAGGSGTLGRGAAAGIGIGIGIVGVGAIVLLAIWARRRMARKQQAGTDGSWQKMRESPQPHARPRPRPRPQPPMEQVARGATPPAPGVFVPPPAVAARKRPTSFRSIGSRSIKSLRNLTPRTSEWYYAANPKQSAELSALPQRGWD